MKQKITIYEKPTCSTCRNVMKAFEAHGLDFEAINYIIDPIPAAKLKEIVEKIDATPQELIRTKEEDFKALKIDPKTLTKADTLKILQKHPLLIQRPIIEVGNKIILGRPVEKVEELLGSL
jgi:arsenate reductase